MAPTQRKNIENTEDTNSFQSIEEVAQRLREDLSDKKCALLFAHNSVGKTRLSGAFKVLGKNETTSADTLYYNAFTEDLFSWDNDLENNKKRSLKLNTESRFFKGIKGLEVEGKIREFLHRYFTFDFEIDYSDDGTPKGCTFFEQDTQVDNGQQLEGIKISRGEERIFIWCFFLAIAQLAIDQGEGYEWVEYIYIDDPVSSLDDDHAIAIGVDLAHLIKNYSGPIKFIISTHHTLFFNVLYNELKHANKYFLYKNDDSHNPYRLERQKGDTPSFYHIAVLKELQHAIDSGELYTYHFNMLRSILEKVALFHGFSRFSDCIKQHDKNNNGTNADEDQSDIDEEQHDMVEIRMINILSHGKYSLFEPVEMLPENKAYFKRIVDKLLANYCFNEEALSQS